LHADTGIVAIHLHNSARILPLRLGLLLALVGATVVLGEPASAAPVLMWTRDLPNVVRESSPVPVDLDADGVLDAAFGAHDGRVWALRGSDGSDVAGWPRQTSHRIDSSPSVADTDGDGRPELFIGAGTSSDTRGALYSFDHDGNQRFRFEARDTDNPASPIHSTPALGDINMSSSADASFGALSLMAWSLDQSGGTNGGWPFYWDDSMFASPALVDVDGDGQTDLIMGGDSFPGGPTNHRGGLVRAITGGGRVIWDFRVNEMVRSSPSVGDIDGDGSPEVVFGTGNYWVRNGGASDATKVYVLSLGGQLKHVWETNGQTLASPTLADLNGDGRLDVAIGTWEGSNPGKVWAWDGRFGAPLPGFNGRDSGGGVVIGQITTADLNGDGGQDLLVPTGAGVFFYDGRNGNPMHLPLALGLVSFQNSPLVTDVEGNGLLDIIIAGGKPDGSGVAFRYEMQKLDNARFGNLGWHMFRRDPRRTGSWTNPPLTQTACPQAGGGGYWMVASDGGIFSFCDANFYGSTGSIRLNQPIVGMASTPSGNGYWLVASDGGIFSFGGAEFYGSTGAMRLNQPILGMASTPSGNGYWLVAYDGGIFSFGDAEFHGSTGAMRLNQPIVGMARTPSGDGYWLVARDGGIFTFGDAGFYGSTGAISLNQPIVGMASTPSGNGYWLVATDGGIFAFGDAAFYGSTGAIRLNQPIVGMARTRNGGGYWLVASDGGIFTFGDAAFYGSTGAIRLNQPIVGMATLGI
jgi:hypothetical protein